MKNPIQSSIYIIYFALMVFFVAACADEVEQPSATPSEQQSQTERPYEEMDAGLIAAGAEIYKGKGICATCHGPDAKGTQLAPNLTDDEWLNIQAPATIDKLVELITAGVPEPKAHPAPMAPKGGAALSDDEIQVVAVYVLSLSQ